MFSSLVRSTNRVALRELSQDLKNLQIKKQASSLQFGSRRVTASVTVASSSKKGGWVGSYLSNQRRSIKSSSRASDGGGTTSTIPTYIWLPILGATGGITYGYVAFLEPAPFTHRTRWIATTPEQEAQMGDREYHRMLQRFQRDILPSDHTACRTVRRVGERLRMASRTFADSNPTARLSTAPHTFTVVRSEQANAFVLPNNHVFVLTGLFRYVKNEDELAAVLGHEMAHNLARHAGEKISGNLVLGMLGRLLYFLDGSGVLSLFFSQFGALFHELPNSREAECEADHIGIHLAAEACYDPRAAKRVFASMKEETTSEKGTSQRPPPEFLSTHPSHDHRLSNFDDWMPAALDIFHSDGGTKCERVRRDMRAARIVAVQER